MSHKSYEVPRNNNKARSYSDSFKLFLYYFEYAILSILNLLVDLLKTT